MNTPVGRSAQQQPSLNRNRSHDRQLPTQNTRTGVTTPRRADHAELHSIAVAPAGPPCWAISCKAFGIPLTEVSALRIAGRAAERVRRAGGCGGPAWTPRTAMTPSTASCSSNGSPF